VDHILRGVQTSIKELVGGDLNKVDARVVAEAAEGGDEVARAVLREAAHYLATAIISAVHVLDPERVVIGGGVARAGKYLVEPVRELVERYAWLPPGAKVEVVAAQLGDDAGILGGARLAFDHSLAV
jgi:glucokinase